MKTLDPLTFEADHHTDLWIAKRVMGWPTIEEGDQVSHYLGHGGVIIVDRPTIFRYGKIPEAFMPSSKIEDAKEVQRKMGTLGWDCLINSSASENNVLVFFSGSPDPSKDAVANAETESLSICRAAGLAVIGEKK